MITGTWPSGAGSKKGSISVAGRHILHVDTVTRINATMMVTCQDLSFIGDYLVVLTRFDHMVRKMKKDSLMIRPSIPLP